jgi:uncharacterized protein
MKPLTIEHIKNSGWLILETIIGSKAYGLNTASSDTDIRGVFILPKEAYYGLEYTAQVNNATNDIVYYELKRFLELLANNNPNILEMLAVPQDCILYQHALMRHITVDLFLSKKCEGAFANYAFTQIKKASGLEKKVMNPMEEIRKSVLDFCYVQVGNHSIALKDYLAKNNFLQAHCGLAKIDHFRDCYYLYYSTQNKYYGVVKSEDANEVHLTNIPKGEMPIGVLFFNKDGYSIYCKQYREYWDWVAKRNEERYKGTITHGKKYDAKNMMHVFRLLRMAKEIALEGKINVWRTDRAFLLNIKTGKFEYDDLVQQATSLKDELPILFAQSNLQDEPDIEKINTVLIKMRMQFYEKA